MAQPLGGCFREPPSPVSAIIWLHGESVPGNLIMHIFLFFPSVASFFSVITVNVFAVFSRFKIEESWPCGFLPRLSVFHNSVQRGHAVLRRKELCFSWPRAHEEKEECFSTGDSTSGKKYGNGSYRRSFQEITVPHKSWHGE